MVSVPSTCDTSRTISSSVSFLWPASFLEQSDLDQPVLRCNSYVLEYQCLGLQAWSRRSIAAAEGDGLATAAGVGCRFVPRPGCG